MSCITDGVRWTYFYCHLSFIPRTTQSLSAQSHISIPAVTANTRDFLGVSLVSTIIWLIQPCVLGLKFLSHRPCPAAKPLRHLLNWTSCKFPDSEFYIQPKLARVSVRALIRSSDSCLSRGLPDYGEGCRSYLCSCAPAICTEPF